MSLSSTVKQFLMENGNIHTNEIRKELSSRSDALNESINSGNSFSVSLSVARKELGFSAKDTVSMNPENDGEVDVPLLSVAKEEEMEEEEMEDVIEIKEETNDESLMERDDNAVIAMNPIMITDVLEYKKFLNAVGSKRAESVIESYNELMAGLTE